MKSSTKYLKILTNYLLMLLGLFLVFYVAPRLIAFFYPFVIAAIIAFIANPLVRFLESKIKIKRKAGSVVVIVLTLALVVLASYGIIAFLIDEISGLADSLPGTWRTVSHTIKSFNDSYSRYLMKLPHGVKDWFDSVGDGITDGLSNWVSSLGESTAAAASDMMKNIPLMLVCIIMCILASYLFVAERDNIAAALDKYVSENIKNRWNLVMSTMKSAVGGYFKAQFKIEIFVYVVLFAGLLILRIKYAFLIALLIALLDFLPMFGAGAVMWPWAVIALLEKDYRLAAGMMIVWAIGQVVRQVIQPKMVGDSMGVPPIPTLVLLYIGFRLGGAIGLIIAIPVGMILYNLYKAGLFSNFIYSTKILVKDVAEFRKFSDKELEDEGIRTVESPSDEE